MAGHAVVVAGGGPTGLMMAGELPNVSPANPKYQLAIALWQKLPLAVTMRVGPMIVRAIP